MEFAGALYEFVENQIVNFPGSIYVRSRTQKYETIRIENLIKENTNWALGEFFSCPLDFCRADYELQPDRPQSTGSVCQQLMQFGGWQGQSRMADSPRADTSPTRYTRRGRSMSRFSWNLLTDSFYMFQESRFRLNFHQSLIRIFCLSYTWDISVFACNWSPITGTSHACVVAWCRPQHTRSGQRLVRAQLRCTAGGHHRRMIGWFRAHAIALFRTTVHAVSSIIFAVVRVTRNPQSSKSHPLVDQLALWNKNRTNYCKLSNYSNVFNGTLQSRLQMNSFVSQTESVLLLSYLPGNKKFAERLDC